MLPSSPKAPCRAGKTASAPSRPPPGTSSTAPPAALQPPSRPIVTSTASWPASRRPARDRRAGAQRDVVLGGAAAGEDRDLHGSSSASSSAFGRALADRDRHRRPRFQFAARRRELVDHAADLARHFGFFFFDARASGRRRGSLPPLRRRSLPITFGTFARFFFFAAGDDDRDRRARFDLGCRRSGDWRITCALRRGLSSSETLGSRPRPRIRCTATSRWLPTSDRHLDQLRPARDEEGDGRAVGRGVAAAAVRSGRPALLRPSRS